MIHPATTSVKTVSVSSASSPLNEPSKAQTQQASSQMRAEWRPHSYPSMRNWLEGLHDDMERGRDGFNYRSLLPVFEENEIKWLDDVYALRLDLLKEIVQKAQVEASIGLITCIIRYAQEDISSIRQ